jgi:putative heme iron utilization protein
MAKSVRLTDEDAEGLRRYASAHGLSMQQAAQTAIRRMLSEERRARFIERIVAEDADLLHRLSEI